MKHLKFILLAVIVAMVWLLPNSTFGLQEASESAFSVKAILSALTPIIVLGTTELTKWALPKLPGIVILIIATTWSSVIAWVAQLLELGSDSWLDNFLYGLLAIVVNQIGTQVGNYKKGTTTS